MAQLVGYTPRELGGLGITLSFFFPQGLPGPTGPVGLPGPPGSSGLVVSESHQGLPQGAMFSQVLCLTYPMLPLTSDLSSSGSSRATRFAWTSGES